MILNTSRIINIDNNKQLEIQTTVKYTYKYILHENGQKKEITPEELQLF